MNLDEQRCKYCGREATQYLFAQFVCDSDDCVNRARDERGGPGGHQLRKEHSTARFGEMDFDS